MKKEPKETTIRELFQQLKREDEQQAPPFTDSWAAARSRLKERRQPLRARWALAVVAAILIACGLTIYRTIRIGSDQGKSVVTERATAPQPPVKRPAAAVEKIAAESAQHHGLSDGLRAPRHRRGNRPRFNNLLTRDDVITADSVERENTTDFIPLRYGDDQKPMESGEVIRVQMPRSALITLGLPVNVVRADEQIMADLLIGEDGLARAIRFVR
jgi:hypothetical protein